MKSAAAVISASEKAIWTTTSGLRGRNRQRRRTASSPACSFRSPITATARKLQRRPEREGERAEQAEAKASRRERQGSDRSSRPCRSAQPVRARPRADRTTKGRGANRTAPPSSARTNLRTSSCLTMRQRLPPRASRIAISFRRAVPRASSMFARLRQATSRTTAAMPAEKRRRSWRSVRRRPRARAGGESGERRRREGLVLLLHRERLFEIRRQTVLQSGRGGGGGQAGFQPADQHQVVVPARSPSGSVAAAEIVRDCVVNAERQPDLRREKLIVPVNPSGMMPTTVKGRPLIRSLEPRSAGSRPCFCQ